jgi:hypothetical protein
VNRKLVTKVLRALTAEDRVPTRAVTPKPPTEVMDGERADVSWMTNWADVINSRGGFRTAGSGFRCGTLS